MSTTEITAPEGLPFVTITCTFDAPRELLLRAHTDPELLVRWLGPRRMQMTVQEFEARDGGRYRYTHAEPGGEEHVFRGVFHGTPSVDGIVQTFEYENWPGHVSLESVAFEESDGRTTVVGRSVFQSVEARDAMVGGGMEHGVREGHDRLAEVLADLVPAR